MRKRGRKEHKHHHEMREGEEVRCRSEEICDFQS